MKIINLLGAATLTIALTVPVNAFARDVYPERSVREIYVLSIEDGKALIKTKGAEKEYVTVGDIIGEERMTVVKIDAISITIRSEDGRTVTTLPLGGGVSY